MNLNYFNERLKTLFQDYPDGLLKEAMLYAMENGGKRIRPSLFIAVLESYGINSLDYYDIAVAIEMIHTYSLIHDDLPAMDDDTLRRGKPTVHIAFNEAAAILAGDALLTEAFTVISQASQLSSEKRIKLIAILASKSGANGMVYGQMLDLMGEGNELNLEALKKIHLNKTAKLIEASLMMAALIASEKDLNIWETIGRHIGLAFQIQDDILEATSTEQKMGKTLSDTDLNKSTYVKVLGLEESLTLVQGSFNQIDTLLKGLTINEASIKPLILAIKDRKK